MPEKLTILDYLPILTKAAWLVKAFNGNNVIWKQSQGYWITVPFRQPKHLVPYISVLIYGTFSCFQFIFVVSKNGLLSHIPSAFLLTFLVVSWAIGASLHRHGSEVAAFNNSLILAGKSDQSVDKSATRTQESKKQAKKLFTGETHKSLYSPEAHVAMAKDLSRGEMGRVVPFVWYHTQVLVPVLTLAFLLHSPCTIPIFLRSCLSDCPASSKSLIQVKDGLLPRLVVTLLDVFCLTYVISQGCFAIGVGFYNGCVCLTDSLRKIQRNVSNKSKEPSDRELLGVIQQYQRLKILEAMYNNMNMSGTVLWIILDMFLLSTFSLYTCVALHDHVSVPMLAMIALVGGETMFLAQIGMYNAAGNVNFVSKNLLANCIHDKTFRKSKYIWRMLRSCCPLKIKIGTSGNYMEKITPLNITQMTVDQATSLILVTKN